MVKKRIAIILAALLILSMLPGLALGAQVTLNLTKSSAAVGESIIASGNADPDEWVSIKVVDSNGSIVVYDAVKSNSSGEYSCTFKVPQVSPGKLTVVSGYGTNVATQLLAISASGGDGGDVPTPVSLESISISKAATKTVYTVGESLDISGLEVSGHYSDGSSRVESISPANITGFDSTSPAESQVLTITVNGKTTSYTVEIKDAPVPDRIEISKAATKTLYTVGESLDISGLEVTGYYSDGSSKVESISPANITGFDSTSPAESQVLTITVNGKTTSYTVEIKDAPVPDRIEISKAATKTLYTVGESLDISGLEVTGYYSDGSSKVESISPANITGFDSTSPAESQVLTITVNGKTTSYTVEIKDAPVPDRIEISKAATKTLYTVGESLDISGLEVTGYYSDGSSKVESISPANITGFDSTSPAESQVLTITVNGKTTSYTVEIKDAPVPDRIEISKAATKTLYTVGESLDISGLEVTGYYSDGSSKVESISPANITGFDSTSPAESQVLTITIAGKTTSYVIVIAKPVEAQKDETIEISKDTPVTITVPKEASGTKIKVEPKETLPLVKIKSETTLGTVEMTIPEGTSVINAPAGWDGSIPLPEVRAQASTTVTEAQQVNVVIEVGLPDEEISFDKAVRLLIPGQKGKSVGFIRKGIFTEISYIISQDDQDTADKELVNNLKDGKVDTANDLAIWTKHFTEFIAYTPKASGGSSGGGGGGGGGFVSPTGNTVGSGGGTIEEAGVRVSFPANAVSSDIKVSINKLNASSVPAIASGFKLLGEAYEISSDRNTTFAKPVTITLPFDWNQADKDKYGIGLYTWNNSQWVILEQVKVDSTAGKISGEVKHFSKFAVLAREREKEKEPAKDVIAPVKATLKDITGHWAENHI